VEGDVHLFGSDLLTIAVPAGNPANVTGLDVFLPGTAPVTAICAEGTSCGGGARSAFRHLGIDAAPNATDLTPLELLLGVAARNFDAGILFRAQASARADQIDLVALPTEVDLRSDYSVVAVHRDALTDRV